MTCEVCGDLGMLIQEWTDAPHDFAVCLCDAGQRWRVAENHDHRVTPQWLVWCARWQVDPARVFLLEKVYSAAELASARLSKQPVSINREAALMAAAAKRAKR